MIRRLKDTISIKVLLLIIVMVLPLNIIALLETKVAIETTVDQVIMSEQALADLYMSNLEMRMENSISLLYQFVSEDVNCIRMVGQPQDEYSYRMARNKFFYTLRRIAEMTNGADGYYFYMKDKMDQLYYSKYSADVDAIYTLEENLSGGDWNKAKTGWHIYPLEKSTCLLYQYKMGNIAYGAWIILDDIVEEIKGKSEFAAMGVIYTEASEFVVDKSQLNVEASAKKIKLHITVSRKEVLAELSIYNRFMFFVALLLLLVIPLLYLLLKRMLLKPLHIINDAHRQIQLGNPYYRINAQGTSKEFMEAFKSFNSMAENLYTYKIDAYEKNIAYQKMELRNLQLQIHPHFLLNSFNLIYNLAQNKKMEDVQETIIYLSDYFRYIFRINKELELLGKELSIIRGYVRMASKRYPNGIEVDYDFDPELEFVRIPPLLLHNFVENSIKYGVKEGETLHISIKGEYENKKVIISIIDDGNGMDEEVLERNRRVFSGNLDLDDECAHMGLYNSLKRLKHFYGEDSGIEVDSEKGSMAAFTIYFSYNLEVDDESIIGE